MRVNCKDHTVSISYVQHEPRKYPMMLQNRQSHELINYATTVWLIEFGKNETTLINYFLATTWTKKKK